MFHTKSDRPRAKRGDGRLPKGIALILTLLILTILVILVAQLRLTTRLNVVRSRNFTGDLQNVYGVRAGLEFARLYLQVDSELAGSIDTLREPWARPLTVPDMFEASVQVQMEDEERRINLARLTLPDGKPNPIVRAQLAKLVAVLGIPDERLGDRIADYVDADAEGEFEGGAKNAMLVIPEELAMIPGVLPEHLYGGVHPDTRRPFAGILEFVTMWPIPPPVPTASADPSAAAASGAPPPAGAGAPPGAPPVSGAVPPGAAPGTPPPSGAQASPWAPPPPPVPGGPAALRFGVNVNTAPLQVLLALSPAMTPEIAEGMIAYRQSTDAQGNPYAFTDIPDLHKVQGMTQQVVESIQNEIVFRGQVFSARVTSRSRNVMKRVRYVLERGAPGIPPRLLTWWEEGGAFGLPQPPESR